MTDDFRKSLDDPDEVMDFPGMESSIVDLGDAAVGLTVYQPNWRWTKDVRPLVGGEWCPARHVGVVLSGRLGVELEAGLSLELGPNDVFDIPPGHDTFTVGDAPCVTVEWQGLRARAGFRVGRRRRVLATLLYTDVSSSDVTSEDLVDIAWRERIARHYEALRDVLERFRGREVKTTGRGMLTTFDGPGLAIDFAHELMRSAPERDVVVRAAIHVGEVDPVGTDLRGPAVDMAAGILSRAGDREVLVSEIVRALVPDAALLDRGAFRLPGSPVDQRLFALEPGA